MKILLSIFFFLLSHSLFAQYTFSGTVTDEKNANLPGSQVVLYSKDSVCAASLTDKAGQFRFKGLPGGVYTLTIQMAGYSPIEEQRTIQKDQHYSFSLVPEMNVDLDEVEIKANRGDKVQRTATGQIFFLSEKAKNSGNPFLALQEIPRLVSNDASQSVKMEDGSAPLILVDGISINTGISPIDPKDIESVEIMDVVDARYLRTGKRHILNIKLKKKKSPYRYFETMTRHDIPLRIGMGAVYFEVGNAKYSLYGRGVATYTHDDNTDLSNMQQGNDYMKRSMASMRKDQHDYLGELLFKWRIAPKDYMIFHVYMSNNVSKDKTYGDGIYETVSVPDSFTYNVFNSDKSNLLTTSLYHKHDFSEDMLLETTFAYNRNWNKSNSERTEDYTDWLYHSLSKYDNRRDDFTFNMDYSWQINSTHSLNIGSEVRYLEDHIDLISDNNPLFFHREWTGYIYSSYSGKINSLLYMLSLGGEGIWLKAGERYSRYYKPRASASVTYNLTSNHSFRLDYTLTNQAPSVGQLNPYNTSTDSLVRVVGNPDLKPMQKQNISAAYTFNKYGLYIEPGFEYTLNTDIVEACGYTENNIYTSTYKNSGRSEKISVGGSLSYRLGNWGRLYSYAYHNIDYFEGLNPRKSVSVGGGFNVSYKKWRLYGDVSYVNYEHTPVSRVHYKVPTYSSVQMNYNFTPNFYIAVALQYLHGKHPVDTYVSDGDYRSWSSQTSLDCSFRPWILLRYTIRKNVKKKINIGNVLNSREDVIKLK